jgi:hypothetical protein
MREVVRFFRANPQLFVLLLVVLILGFGTFFAVVFGLLTAHSSTTTGEPSGSIPALHTMAALGARAG